MIDILPGGVLLDIFNHYRMDDLTASSPLPWKWHGLAHVCRTWRDIIFASSRRLNLELLCTHGTPVRKTLGYLPTLPIVIYFPNCLDRDEDNILAALEHPDRVRVLVLRVPHSLLEKLATVVQGPFPVLTHLWLRPSQDGLMPVIPDTFLGGRAPRLQEIKLEGIPFPAAPTLLLSACDLIDVNLRYETDDGYISPEAMVAGLAVLPKLKYLTFAFAWELSSDQLRLPPIARSVLPTLIRFHFDGLIEYFEDFVAQIDAPQLTGLDIHYLDEGEGINYQIPELCKFIGRSEKFKPSQFTHASLSRIPSTAAIELGGHSRFALSTQGDGMTRVLSQISGILSNVDHLGIGVYMDYGLHHYGAHWLERIRPFTAVKTLGVHEFTASSFRLFLNNLTEESVAEVLPALGFLCLVGEPVASVGKFIAARRNVGRPVFFSN